MFESGVSASWVTLPTGELLVGETLRRAVGSPTGPDTVSVLLAVADAVRTEEERGLLGQGWVKVTAWAAGQAVDHGVDASSLPAPLPAPLVAAGEGGRAAGAGFGTVPVSFPGRPGAARNTAFVEHLAATDAIERACTVPAGPEQVAALARIEPSLVAEDGPALTGLIEAYEQISWLTARKLAVVAEKHDATARAMRQHPDSLHEMWTRDGIAAGLHVVNGHLVVPAGGRRKSPPRGWVIGSWGGLLILFGLRASGSSRRRWRRCCCGAGAGPGG